MHNRNSGYILIDYCDPGLLRSRFALLQCCVISIFCYSLYLYFSIVSNAVFLVEHVVKYLNISQAYKHIGQFLQSLRHSSHIKL